jgi:glycosyltransferase involved in cell wall biosynthesis
MAAALSILHLSSEKTWRGGEQQIAYLLEELNKHGVRNHVAARKGSAFEAHCRKENIPLIALPFKNAIDIGTALAIKRYCREHGIDLVHMHSAKSHGLGVISHVFGNETPLVLSRRVMFSPKRSWFTRWKYNHRAISRVLCVSDKTREVMQAYLKHPEKAVTVYSGVDLHKFDPSSRGDILLREGIRRPGLTVIGNTAALEYEKDYTTFIDTVDTLVQKKLPVQAVIIGKGSQEESLKKYVEDKQLQDVITFTGFRKDLVALLPELDIFLMPSILEGLGTSVLDAFLAHVPVVATQAGGIPEMVLSGRTGLLAPAGDSTVLAEHIEAIMTNPVLRETLIQGAQEKVKEFSKEKMATRTLAIYHEVVGNTSR